MPEVKPTRPTLTEEKMNTMLARASRVYRGESAPRVQCAEDVIYLIGEVKSMWKQNAFLRAQLDDLRRHVPIPQDAFDAVFGDVFKTMESYQDSGTPPAMKEQVKAQQESTKGFWSWMKTRAGWRG